MTRHRGSRKIRRTPCIRRRSPTSGVGTRRSTSWQWADFRRSRPDADVPAPITAPGRFSCREPAHGIFPYRPEADCHYLTGACPPLYLALTMFTYDKTLSGQRQATLGNFPPAINHSTLPVLCFLLPPESIARRHLRA